ncbi:unnamed protein product, partial [Amoebophrya sp. A25]|eukprot:GSA25T00007826001.1
MLHFIGCAEVRARVLRTPSPQGADGVEDPGGMTDSTHRDDQQDAIKSLEKSMSGLSVAGNRD